MKPAEDQRSWNNFNQTYWKSINIASIYSYSILCNIMIGIVELLWIWSNLLTTRL